jgi:signal transduction histidine kinase
VGDLARAFAQMQDRLQQQEEARRAFVSTASHELRTPLASLDGMLELLHDDLESGALDLADARSLLDRARTQSRRLARLAADLLDLSRLDAQVQLRSEPVELGELSRAVIAEFDLGTEERGIVSTLDDSAGQVWACGDPGGIARIVRILLDNAVRVSPRAERSALSCVTAGRPRSPSATRGPGLTRRSES